MSVSDYGELTNGQKVQAHTLQNDLIELTVLDYGLRAVSLCFKPRSQQILMGQWPIEQYEADATYSGAVVGRTCNRIGSATFELNGETFNLDQNDGEHHLHGGHSAFHNRRWQIESTEAALVCRTQSSDGEAGYPGLLNVEVVIELEGSKISYHYNASANRETLCDLTNHAYFCLDNSGSIKQHELTISADRYVAVDSSLIPTGELRCVEDTAFDFNQPRTLESGLVESDPQLKIGGGFDHCYLLSESRQINLYSSLSNLELSIETDQPGVQLYTGNFLNDPYSALCLETQHLPNACNQPDFKSPLISPGNDLSSRTSYLIQERVP